MSNLKLLIDQRVGWFFIKFRTDKVNCPNKVVYINK